MQLLPPSPLLRPQCRGSLPNSRDSEFITSAGATIIPTQGVPGLLGPQGIWQSVLEAVGQTERHRFIPGRSCSVAYMDGPVPIGQGQTISQPFIVVWARLADAAGGLSRPD